MNYEKLLQHPQLPFSQRLNDWIRERVKTIPYRTTTDENPTFEKLKEHWETEGVIVVNTDHAENTVYGPKEINLMSRAWHDWHHLNGNFPFNLEGEVAAVFGQMSELPSDWYLERNILFTDIAGLVASYYLGGQVFPENQREFAIRALKTGKLI